jgi:hypothetical protein
MLLVRSILKSASRKVRKLTEAARAVSVLRDLPSQFAASHAPGSEHSILV